MTARAELYRLVDQLDETDVPEALHYLTWLATEDQSATETTRGEVPEGDTTEGVEYAKLGRPTDAHDSLWNIVGIGRTPEQTDVREHKDEYLADAFALEASDS